MKIPRKYNNNLSEIQEIIVRAAVQNKVNVNNVPNNANKVIYIKEGEKIYSINEQGIKRRSYKKEKNNNINK